MYSVTSNPSNGDKDSEFIFRILFLGNRDVGKSTFFVRFVDDFWDDTCVPTIGVEYKIKTLEIDQKKIKMLIWDPAGQRGYKNIMTYYYRGLHGIFLVYDVTDEYSFRDLNKWLIEIEKNASKNVIKVLIGNKTDLEDKRVISYDEGKKFADTYGFKFIETSVKKNVNIREAFEILGRELEMKKSFYQEQIKKNRALKLKQQKKKFCNIF